MVSTKGTEVGPVIEPVGNVGLKLNPIGHAAETARSAVYGTSFAFVMISVLIVPAPLSSTAEPPVAAARS